MVFVFCCKEGHKQNNQEEYIERGDLSFGNRDMNHHEAQKIGVNGDHVKPKVMPPTSVMTRLILIMVWRKLIRNPNTYSSLFGLTWSLICFRYYFYFYYYQIYSFHENINYL